MSGFWRQILAEELGAERSETLKTLEGKAATGGLSWLEVHFAALPRKIGREALSGGLLHNGELTIVAEGFRHCDLAALLVLESGAVLSDHDALFRLYEQGDHEERRMILKALALTDTPGPIATRLLQEAHRTNEHNIFLAGFADSNLPARILDDDDFARGVLKSAFVDLDLGRVVGASDRATPDLSRMLLDFMSEREAAHRSVWPGSLELAAHAPCPGVEAKVHGDLWSGVDARRLAATRAVTVLGAENFRADLEARLEIESYGPILEALKLAR